MSFLRARQQTSRDFTPFHNALHMLVIVLSDMTAGTMSFSEIMGVNRMPQFEEFVSFLGEN